MPDGFAVHEMIFDGTGKPVDYRFLAVNPAFEEITGLAANDIIGQTVLEVLPGTEDIWIQNYGKVVVTGTPLRFESGHTKLNKLFEVHAYRPQEGQFACIFRDITERKTHEAETEVRAEHSRKTAADYRAIFEGALEGILRATLDGRILAANPAMLRMLGFEDESDIKRVSAYELWLHPEDRSRFLRQVEEQKTVRDYEGLLRRKDGTIVKVSLAGRKVIGSDGQTVYYDGFFQDISARKQAEERLHASENKFKMAFMTGTDASSISTLKEGKILEVNDRFSEVFGYSREDACGKTSSELGWYAEDDRDRLISELKRQGHVEEMEFHGRVKNGELRYMLVSASLLQSDHGELILCVIRDITEQKRAAAEKAKLEEQFRQAQKLESIGRMAGGIAHDFNNQLTVINGYGDLLLRACKKGDPLLEWIEEIRNAGERASKLVRQLLIFSRKQSLEPRSMRLEALIGENRSMLQRFLGEDVQLVVESEPAGWLVMADPGQLHQVLMNLTVNARDAMPRGGTLTIRTANVVVSQAGIGVHPKVAPGQYVVLGVSDTGAGIAKEIQERIFEPFFTTKQEGEGTGLGLSTVYGIVRQLGGAINVQSEPGSGASFEIYLPRLEAEVGVDTPQPATQTASPGGFETILVVEDQAPVRNLMVLALKEAGYHVLESANGTEALLLAEQHSGPIHLLLTDVIMPHMTGKEVANRLRPSRHEMKVLYVSGYAADTLTRRGLGEPDWEFIGKPFAPDQLTGKVREILGPSRPSAAILVVDDDASVRGLFEHVLSEAGYEVVVACDGCEALVKVRERGFNLLLTDLVMPEREGLELIMILRKERPDLKVMAVSGAFGGAFLEAAEALGASAVLLKPVSPGQLLDAVRNIVG